MSDFVAMNNGVSPLSKKLYQIREDSEFQNKKLELIESQLKRETDFEKRVMLKSEQIALDSLINLFEMQEAFTLGKIDRARLI